MGHVSMDMNTDASQPVNARAPLSTNRAWTAAIALGIAAFAMVSTEFLPVGLLPGMARDMGVSEGRAGLMVTLPGLLAALAAPLIIALAGSIDRRKLLAVLVGLLVLSNVIVALSGSLLFALVGRVLLGLAVGGFWTIGGSLGPRLMPGPASAKASAIILSGVSMGTVAGVPAGAWLGELLGWRWAFGASAAISLLVLGLLMAALPPLPGDASGRGLRDVPSLLRLPKVRLGLAAIVLVFVGQFASYTYISTFLLQLGGVAPAALGVILLAYGLAGFAGNLLGGWLAGRSSRAAAVSTGILLGLSVILLVLLGRSFWSSLPLTIAWGLGFGMLPIAMQTWMFSAAPRQIEAVQAVFVSVAQAAIGVGALVGGVLVDHLGVSNALWFGAAGAILMALVMSLGGFSREWRTSFDRMRPDAN
jgi:predicted MFS family arabinose efflux permease